MATKQNGFENISGAVDGLALTGSLTAGGGDQLTIAGTSSRWTLRSGGMHGSWSARITRNQAGSGENPVMLYSTTGGATQAKSSVYFLVEGMPTQDSCFAVFSNSGGSVAYAYLTATGVVYIKSAGGTVTIGTSPALVVINKHYRLDLSVIVGATTSNGAIRAALSLRDRSTPLWSVTSTAANVGTTALTNWQFGAPVTSTSAAFNMRFDDPYLEDTDGSVLVGAHGYTLAGSARFDEVLVSGGFTATTDPVADLSDGSTSTGVTSPGVTTNETTEYSVPPVTPGSFSLTVQVQWLDAANSMRLTLRQGSTPSSVGTQIRTQLYTLTSTVAPYTFTNGPSENAAVTDWNDLSVQVVFGAS